MIFNLRLGSWIMAVLSVCACGCQSQVRNPAIGDFENIRSLLRTIEVERSTNAFGILSAQCPGARRPSIVSAERIFTNIIETNLPTFVLSPLPPLGGIKKDNPLVSRYNSWCMNAEQWALADEFAWYDVRTEQVHSFPVLWEKADHRLSANSTVVFSAGFEVFDLPQAEFTRYYREAVAWMEPNSQWPSAAQLIKDLESRNIQTRFLAVRRLARLDGQAHGATICGVLKKEDSWPVIRAAIWALGWTRYPSAGDSLDFKRVKDYPYFAPDDALHALGRIGTDAASLSVQTYFQSDTAYVRQLAAKTLGTIGSPQAVRLLREQLAKTRDPDTTNAIKAALSVSERKVFNP